MSTHANTTLGQSPSWMVITMQNEYLINKSPSIKSTQSPAKQLKQAMALWHDDNPNGTPQQRLAASKALAAMIRNK